MESCILILLCLAAFVAGFIDAIVGGGGLIQTPVTMIMLPQLSVANVIGTLKIPAFSGTSFAAFQYLKKVSPAQSWALYIFAVIGLSYLAYHWIEKPGIALGRAVVNRLNTRRVQAQQDL